MSSLLRNTNFGIVESFPLYFAPDNLGTIGSGSPVLGETNRQNIIDLFDADDTPPDDKAGKEIPDDEKQDKKEGKGKDKGEGRVRETPDEDEEVESEDEKEDVEDIDELDELEEEITGPEEDKLEPVTSIRRRDILKAYPDFFKKFPDVERSIYRERAFSELYPTIEDAKEASEKATTLDKFDADLKKGDIEQVLKVVKTHDQNTFNKVVDNYMEALFKIDKDAQNHVIAGIINNTIVAMVEEANEKGEDGTALKQAAQLLNQFVFGRSKFKPVPKLFNPDAKTEAEDDKKDPKRDRYTQERFTRTTEELGQKVDNILSATITKYIDPRESMTEYIRGHAVKDALDRVQGLIKRDGRFQKLLDKLWERAIEDDFSSSSVEKIRGAYISKAKTLLRPVINRARNDALKGMGKRVKEEREEPEEKEHTEERTSRRSSEKPGRSASSQNSGKGKSKDGRGMSTLDYFMQE